MSSFSRGSYSGGFSGSYSQSHSGRRRGRHSRYRRVAQRRGGFGCAVFIGAFLGLSGVLAGVAWWVA